MLCSSGEGEVLADWIGLSSKLSSFGGLLLEGGGLFFRKKGFRESGCCACAHRGLAWG